MNYQPATVCAAFQETIAAHPDVPALRAFDGGPALTWRDYGDRVRVLATGLAQLGVGRGSTVALMLTNRPEFHLLDTAVLHTGAAPYSVYNTNPAEAIAHTFRNSGCEVVICEVQYLERVRAAVRLVGDIRHIVCVDAEAEGTLDLAELETLGAKGPVGFDFDRAWQAVGPEDLVTLVYTSGTTGAPKGVELTHANVLANTRAAHTVLSPVAGEQVISYLPDAHAANRWVCHYNSLLSGMCIVTLSDAKHLVEALADVRPEYFLGVPHVWYKIKAALEAAVEDQPSPLRRVLGRWALRTGARTAALTAAPEPDAPRVVPYALRWQYAVAERLVLSRIRARLGLDRLLVAASGAAPLAPEALEFLLGLGLPVCEGWGMTEATCVGTFNTPGDSRIGTVGRAIAGVELRTAEDGELLLRGPSVMRGYRGDTVRTAETVDTDGWLHTGDIAEIDADGYVRIIDRKKDLIINASGKNMSPANIENTLKVACPLIGWAVAIGDNRPYVTALLTLDPEEAAAFAVREGIREEDPFALVRHPRIRAEIESAVADANASLSRVEQVRKFTLLTEHWEPGSDEITPSLKLRRRPIVQRYASEIEAHYRP